ncbi:MAG TPA: hypothetical protein VMX57_02345, partial [Planctomycetota bacterium]|nr:hypothetical protein [Planctomycetota bacterium]
VEWLKVNAGPTGAASAANASGDLGEKPRLAGELNVLADLPTALPAVGRITRTTDLPKVRSGRLEWNPVVESDGTTTRLSNKPGTQGVVTDLVVGEGTKTFTDKRVVFDLSVDVNPSHESAGINRLTVDSTHLWFTCKGIVTSYRTLRYLQGVQGNYRAKWDRLMPLVYQFAPTLEQDLKLSGDTAGTFTLAGPLNQPDAKPPYQFLTGKAEAGWTSAVIYGLPLGKATFAPELAGGVVVLPPMQVDAGQNAEGKINLAGTLDLRTDPPTLQIVKLRPVENLHLTKEFTWQQLGEFFPFFGNLGGVTGIVSVDLESLRYPLSEAGLKQMTGRGTVEMDQFRFRPKGLFGILGKLIGLAQVGTDEEQVMPKTLAPFEVRDGRVYYENVVMWIGKDQDLVFSGWVGFDDRIDMKVSMPGRLLGKDIGTRMVLRITGTRQVPVINPLGTLLPGDSGRDILKGLGDLLNRKKDNE